MDHRLKHSVFLSVDSERVEGRQALSTGSKGLDMWVQRTFLSYLGWSCKALNHLPAEENSHAGNPQTFSRELGSQALGHIFCPLMCGQYTCR